MGRVAAIGCILCRHIGFQGTPAEVHHLKIGTGASDKASDWLTIPLCPRHHRVEYPDSVHALKEEGLKRKFKVGELDLLAMTIEAVYGGVR